MLKRGFAILILAALAAQSFSQLGIVAYYRLNRAYIAKYLCINRDKPMMHCNGKCYLARQLRENEQREHQGNVEVKADIALFCSTSQDFLFPSLPAKPIVLSRYCPGDYSRPFFSIFHPPQA